MKIVWLTLDTLFPLNEAGRLGIYKRIEYICRYHDVYLYYFYTKDFERLENNRLKNICKKVYGYKRDDNKCKLLYRSVFYPYTISTRINRNLVKDLNEVIQSKEIDLINIDFPQMGYYLMKCRNYNNIPVIMNLHNIEWKRFLDISKSSSISCLRRLVTSIEAIRLKIYEGNLYRKNKINVITFVSENDKNYFRNWIKNIKARLEIIPAGGELKALPETVQKSGNLLFVGVMSNELNPEGALWFIKNVLPIIKEEINSVTFYVVGKNPVKKLLSINDSSVVVTGYVDDLDEYYRKADAVVIPILHGGGVKLKLLEAIGRGKLVITTSEGARGTEFMHGEHIFICDDSEDFAKACINVLNNPNLYANMRKRALSLFKEKYSWEVIGRRYNKLLEETVYTFKQKD